jgi:hypothetical protein
MRARGERILGLSAPSFTNPSFVLRVSYTETTQWYDRPGDLLELACRYTWTDALIPDILFEVDIIHVTPSHGYSA